MASALVLHLLLEFPWPLWLIEVAGFHRMATGPCHNQRATHWRLYRIAKHRQQCRLSHLPSALVMTPFTPYATTDWIPMRRILATAALLAVASAPQAQASTLGSLDFKACSLSTPFSGNAIAAQCAVLQVPENPAAPSGRRIGLKIAWIPADRDDAAEPDPVFMLAGGPGQSATESYPQAASAFDETRKKRHIILVDQRGTGGSNPLSCKEPFDENELPTPKAASAAMTCATTCRSRSRRRRVARRRRSRFRNSKPAASAKAVERSRARGLWGARLAAVAGRS
jgi:hypothetical protein